MNDKQLERIADLLELFISYEAERALWVDPSINNARAQLSRHLNVGLHAIKEKYKDVECPKTKK
jgi:hypothetical protein